MRGIEPPSTVVSHPHRGIIGTVTAVAAGIAGVVFSEGWVIASVAAFGPPIAFVVVAAACSAVSVLIAVAYDADERGHGTRPVVARVRSWIERRRAAAEGRASGLWRLSGFVAVAVLSVTAGPFLTTLAVKVRGARRSAGLGVAAASSVLFSAVWVAVYAGGIGLLRQALGT